MGGCCSTKDKYMSPPPNSPMKRPKRSGDQDTNEPLLQPDSNGKVGKRATSADHPESPTTQEQRLVVASDSGIESLGSPQDEAHAELAEKVCTECQQPFNRDSQVIHLECGHPSVLVGAGLPLPNSSGEDASQPKPENYCSCGPRHAGKQNVCKTHLNSPKAQRHSDIFSPGLKSSFKKEPRVLSEHKARLSWKSADSLDIGASMTTPMDRCRSEVSEIFGDDISLRAPLAAFDSVEGSLGYSAEAGASMRQQLNSGVAVEQSLLRGMCRSECENFAQDLVQEVDKMLAQTIEEEKSLTAELKRMDSEGDDGMTPVQENRVPENGEMVKAAHQTLVWSVKCPAKPREFEMIIRDDRKFVLMDPETFSQLLDELSNLKRQLRQVHDVLMEDGITSLPTRESISSSMEVRHPDSL